MFTVNVNFEDAARLLRERGLEPGGRVQKVFTAAVMGAAKDYVPFRSGALQSSARLIDNYTAVIYDTPYARYHWYGKLMVDPLTGKGAFHDPVSGRFWSRPNVQKVRSEQDLTYHEDGKAGGSALRGPRWVERAWIDHKEAIVERVEKEVKKRP